MPGIAQTTPLRWTHTTLSEGKVGMGTAALGDKIIFFSGSRLIGGTTRELVAEAELFNVHTGEKQILPINSASARIAASGVSVGSKFIFAGGDNGWATDKVDIYDTLTQLWSTAQLSLDRYFISAVSLNGKALFAGGSSKTEDRPVSNVDIYAYATDSWSVINLPQYENTPYRRNIGGIAYGNNAYFAGGVQGVYEDDNCKYVSVFNAQTNTWLSSISLSNKKTDICTGVYSGKIYFAGGTVLYHDEAFNYTGYPSDTMNVYDTLTGSMDAVKIPKLLYTYASQFPNKRPWVRSVQAGCKMFLIPELAPFGGVDGVADTIAIYDMARNVWTFEALPNPRTTITPIACLNKVYFAGGQNVIGNYNFRDDIDIYNLYPVLKTSVNNSFANTYDFGTIENNTHKQIAIKVSNEGDYDLLFDATATYTLTGDLSVFSIDPSTLPGLSDTLAPAKIISIPVLFQPLNSGNYNAVLTIKSNDPAMPVYSFHVSGSSSADVPTAVISNVPAVSYIKLYPNPSKGIVTIENMGEQNLTRAEIINPQGRLLKEIQLTGTETTVDVSDLKQGIYFVRLTDDKSFAVVKLVRD